MADEHKRNQIIFSIQKYLADLQQNPTGTIDTDSLEVVVQCLKASFSVDISEAEHQNLYSIPKSLTQIFEDGYFNTQNNNNNAPASNDDIFESNFQQYLRVLTDKGYFNNVEKGSAEYNTRVQKAREKLEENERAKQQENESKAEEKKTEGNALVAAKQFEQAIQAYTEAITLSPKNPIYYANRAAAHSHLKQHKEAIEDCKLAITVDPTYTKAYSRMGLAHFSLEEYEEAFSAYKKAFELDPSEVIKQSLNIAEKKLKERAEKLGAKSAVGAAGAGAGAGAGGNPLAGLDFSSLLSNPAVQNILSGLGGAGGAGNAPSNEGLSTGVNPEDAPGNMPGGMPNISELLNNPQIRNAAENVMNNPNLSSLLNNPAIMNMASSLLKNPDMINSVLQNFGGGGGFPGFPPNNNNQ